MWIAHVGGGGKFRNELLEKSQNLELSCLGSGVGTLRHQNLKLASLCIAGQALQGALSWHGDHLMCAPISSWNNWHMSQQEKIHVHPFVLGPELRIHYTYT